ncbi:MAG: GNAT family N-acetyltransferase [Flavisolibacter sp.]
MIKTKIKPFIDLQTPRCLLRKITVVDAPEVWILNSHPNIMQYLDRESLNSPQEAIRLINRIEYDLENEIGIMWGITTIGYDKLIGIIGFWRVVKEHFRGEIGFFLHPDWWNKGFMKECIETVVQYGFTNMNLHSIEANVNPANKPSIFLLEKLGFNREAYFKENYYFNGKFIDSITYSLVNKQSIDPNQAYDRP